jgi:precorrin-2/cobalt-factor-2 C20-methyltransferase
MLPPPRSPPNSTAVMTCQGDPLFYGSSINVFSRLAGQYRIEIVPGVSSLSACAAAAAIPLASRDETLSVIPATLEEAELAARLTEAETAAIVKLGRHLAKVRRALSRLGLLDGAIYVEHATLPSQRVIPLAQAESEGAPYFSMALVCHGGFSR